MSQNLVRELDTHFIFLVTNFPFLTSIFLIVKVNLKNGKKKYYAVQDQAYFLSLKHVEITINCRCISSTFTVNKK